MDDEALAFIPHPQRSNKRLLRDAHAAIFPHPLLALFLFLQKLSLAGGVAAVAFGRHVLSERADRFPGDDLAADRGLDRDLEHVAGDEVL